MPSTSDTQQNAIGRFLQARRAQLSPEEAGVPDFGRRRVPGLRREEVAHLAGVSATYYSRLEQGRDRHPSPAILEAIGRALRLDPDAQRHLMELAVEPAETGSTTREASDQVIDAALEGLLRRHIDAPAYVLGRHADVLAANALARALHVSFRPGRNFVSDAFLDADARAGFHPEDLEATMAHGVALLHASEGPSADHERLAELISELEVSPEFRRLWPRHEIRRKTAGAKRFVHPVVGPIRLGYNAFAISGFEGQTLVVCHAKPGSEDERQLVRLGALSPQDVWSTR
jgi:transcriptional regulator with XRE-family HTH domain